MDDNLPVHANRPAIRAAEWFWSHAAHLNTCGTHVGHPTCTCGLDEALSHLPLPNEFYEPPMDPDDNPRCVKRNVKVGSPEWNEIAEDVRRRLGRERLATYRKENG